MFAKLNAAFSGLDLIFLLMAAFGGLLFVARMGLAMLGLGHHDVSTEAPSEFSVDHDAPSGPEASDSSFNMLTIQGLTAFFLMFGLVGLAMHRGSHMSEAASIIGGFVAGVLMMALLAKLVQLLFKLQSSGNTNLQHAIGQIGTIYLTIPAGGGTGQIQIGIDGRLVIYDAVAENKQQTYKTGDRVQVTQILDNRLLVVKKA